MTPWSGLTEWTMITLLFASSRPPPLFSASSSDGPEEDDHDEGASSKNAPTPDMLFVEWRSWWSPPPCGLIDRKNMAFMTSSDVGCTGFASGQRNTCQKIKCSHAKDDAFLQLSSHRVKETPAKKDDACRLRQNPSIAVCHNVHALFKRYCSPISLA